MTRHNSNLQIERPLLSVHQLESRFETRCSSWKDKVRTHRILVKTHIEDKRRGYVHRKKGLFAWKITLITHRKSD